ncbi:MAG: MFS transporter [Candidatus Binatia bacterium]|jgi:MFS family permease
MDSAHSSDPGRLRWAILVLITVSHVVGAVAQYGINTLAPFYQPDLDLSRAQIGLFFTAFYTGMGLFSTFAGKMADRLGVGATVLAGHIFLGIWTAAAALAPSFSWAFASFLLAGIGYSFLNPASTKGVMMWFDRTGRATAMGIKQTGVPAGGVVAALLCPVLVLLAGWRWTLAYLGIVNLLGGVGFWLLWRGPPEEKAQASEESETQIVEGGFRKREILAASVATLSLLIAQMCLITYVPLYLKDVMGFSPYWASQALSVAQSGAMVGRIGWGVASDRLFGGRRKVVLQWIGGLSIGLALILSVYPSSWPPALLLLVIFLSGLCMVGYQGVSYALISELGGQARAGYALGLMVTVNSLGVIFGTPLFGYIVDSTGSYAIAWQILAATVFSGMLAFVFLVKEG